MKPESSECTQPTQAAGVTPNESFCGESSAHSTKEWGLFKVKRKAENVIVMWEKLEVLLKGQALTRWITSPYLRFCIFFQHGFAFQETPLWSKPQSSHRQKTRRLSSVESDQHWSFIQTDQDGTCLHLALGSHDGDVCVVHWILSQVNNCFWLCLILFKQQSKTQYI